ncbi:MAG: V-type ATP synthase subunit D [Patescibacteria group bacterium]|nr:V-type ATP synthase subunit D [Patescibacteria group bacterium]
MQVKINPTRVELLKLKKRLKVAQRGHKLLKEKRDGLMKDFMQVVREAKDVREAVEKSLSEAFLSFAFAAAEMPAQSLEAALMLSKMKLSLQTSEKNIMNIKVPLFEVQKEGEPICYGYLDTVAELDTSLKGFETSLEKMVRLAQTEKAILMLSREIEKTRRRVNSLEYVLVPNLQSAIREITMKLDEQERGNLTRLMKVKAMIAAQA